MHKNLQEIISIFLKDTDYDVENTKIKHTKNKK